MQTLPGLGPRSLRYSMLVDDFKVLLLHVDEPGPKNYKISGPQTMLTGLAQLKDQAAGGVEAGVKQVGPGVEGEAEGVRTGGA